VVGYGAYLYRQSCRCGNHHAKSETDMHCVTFLSHVRDKILVQPQGWFSNRAVCMLSM